VIDITNKFREADLSFIVRALFFHREITLGKDAITVDFLEMLDIQKHAYSLGYYKQVDKAWFDHPAFMSSEYKNLVKFSPSFKVTESYYKKIFEILESKDDPNPFLFDNYRMFYRLGFYKEIPAEWIHGLNVIHHKKQYSDPVMIEKWEEFLKRVKNSPPSDEVIEDILSTIESYLSKMLGLNVAVWSDDD
jgi:hypothetical protein